MQYFTAGYLFTMLPVYKEYSVLYFCIFVLKVLDKYGFLSD